MAFEHVTVDERILYCTQCGWEHREVFRGPRARLEPRATTPVRKPQRRR
jgi:hypothetical protein